MSSMISPIKPTGSGGYVNGGGGGGNTTPSGDLQNLRLASCTNLLQNRGQIQVSSHRHFEATICDHYMARSEV